MTSTVRTAEYGPVRSVVWEGIGEANSSPPLSRFGSSGFRVGDSQSSQAGYSRARARARARARLLIRFV